MDEDKEGVQLTEVRDIKAESLTLSGDQKFFLKNKSQKLLRIVNEESSTENTYLFIFREGRPSKEFKLENSSFFHESNPKVIFIDSALPKGEEVFSFCQDLLEEIEKKGIKRINLIGFDEGTAIVQALAILSPRLFRRAVFFNPIPRVDNSLLVKIIDSIEGFLPIGLPFRKIGKDFDSRPFLHRIRCPVLVLSTQDNYYYIRESQKVAEMIPNSYFLSIQTGIINKETGGFSDEFIKLLREFEQVPVKRPQKNLKFQK